MAGDSPSRDADYHILTPPGVPRRSSRIKAVMGILLVALDILMLVSAFVLGYLARVSLPILSPIPIDPPPLTSYLMTMVLHVFTLVVMFYFSRLYHQRRVPSRINQARQILGVVAVGSVLVSGMHELLLKNTPFEVDYPRSMFFYVLVLSAVLVGLGREIHRDLFIFLRRRGIACDNVLIVGTSRVARDITQKIQSHAYMGYKIVGMVSEQIKPKGRMMGIPVVGLYQDLPVLIDTYQVDQVIIALPEAKRAEIVDLITLCQRGQVDIKVYPDMFAYMAGDLNVDDLGGTPLLTVRDIALRGWRLSLKRGLDLFGSLFGLIVLSPLMLLTALLIRLESKGSPFYCQVRMGLDGRPFYVVKFRTMRSDAEASGPGWTVKDDPRVTRMGSFMRRTSWDEITQLINVVMGQMSLVGPRPERPVYVQEFRQNIPRYMERHREKAGMTGWAQVNGLRGDTSIAERTAYDLWYVENWSLWLDIRIIIRTIFNILLRRDDNAY